MNENAFGTVIQEEENREIIETLYEYPYSTILTLGIRMVDRKKYSKEDIKKYRKATQKKRGQITQLLNKIEKFNYFVNDGFDILSPANMFPQSCNHEWMFFSRAYSGMNSLNKTTNFPDTPETIFKTFNGRWLSGPEITELCNVSKHTVLSVTCDLVDADVLDRQNYKVTLNNDYLKKISEWHERKSTPLVEDDEETSVFVKELRKLIGKTPEITAIEKKGIKYYKVTAGGESINLCSNPMGRYLSWV